MSALERDRIRGFDSREPMGEPLTKRRIAIIGGGIGGLTAAIAIAHHLRRSAPEIVVFERAREISANGALLVWSNAIAALESLGLRAPLERIGAPLALTEIRRSNGDLLSSLPVGDWSQELGGASTVVIRRRALLDALRSALPSTCDLRMGATLHTFETTANGVRLELEEGGVETADILIGADGFHSVVRRQMLGEETPREGGYDAWVGITPPPERPKDFRVGVATATLGRGPRFWSAALVDGSIFWYATVNRRGCTVRTPEALRALFDGWHEPIDHLIRSTPRAELIRTRVRDRLPTDVWGRGPITLLGDAAHPSTPDLGQGACQAIESGLVLGRCLSEEERFEDALRSYEEQRMSRTAAISRLCWMTSANSTTEGALTCSARDLAIRVGLESVAKSSLSWILRGSASAS